MVQKDPVLFTHRPSSLPDVVGLRPGLLESGPCSVPGGKKKDCCGIEDGKLGWAVTFTSFSGQVYFQTFENKRVAPSPDPITSSSFVPIDTTVSHQIDRKALPRTV